MRYEAEMARRVDDELVEIVSALPGEWEPDAVDAAKAEIARRGIEAIPTAYAYRSPPQFEAAGPAKDPKAPLEGKVAFRAVLFGAVFGLLAVLLAVSVKRRYVKSGEVRKGEEYLRWTIASAAVSTVFWLALRH